MFSQDDLDYELERSRGLLVGSHAVERALSRDGFGKDIYMLTNADTEDAWVEVINSDRTRVRLELGYSDSDFVICFANSFFVNSGLEELISALSLLPDYYKVVVSGAGPERYTARLKGQIRKLGLEARVNWLLFEPEELNRWRSAFDLGVILLNPGFPNHKQIFPNRLFEILAAGIPLLSSELPEIVRLVERTGVGKIVKDYTPTGIAQSIRQFEDPVVRRACLMANQSQRRELSFDSQKTFLSAWLTQHLQGSDVSVCCAKSISTNKRVARLVKTLVEAGKSITVYSYESPKAGLRVSGVNYIEI